MEITWLIAVPTKQTYSGLSAANVIKQYQNMAFEEFDKQFTKKSDEQILEDLLRIPECKLIQSRTLKKTSINLEMATWKGKPINASFYSIIYTTVGGYPKGEATYICKVDGKTNIVDDLRNFYKRFNWRVGIDSKELCDTDPRKNNNELDKRIIQAFSKLMRVS